MQACENRGPYGPSTYNVEYEVKKSTPLWLSFHKLDFRTTLPKPSTLVPFLLLVMLAENPAQRIFQFWVFMFPNGFTNYRCFLRAFKHIKTTSKSTGSWRVLVPFGTQYLSQVNFDAESRQLTFSRSVEGSERGNWQYCFVGQFYKET